MLCVTCSVVSALVALLDRETSMRSALVGIIGLWQWNLSVTLIEIGTCVSRLT